MAKGVNKNVIEICDTGSDYFERAILFIRPGRADHDADALRRHAGEFLSGVKVRSWWRPQGKIFFTAAKMLCSAGTGAVVAYLLLVR